MMGKNNDRKSSFPLLTAVGILFAVTLCLLASAMVYVAVPASIPFMRFLFQKPESSSPVSSNFKILQGVTPFQPSDMEMLETPAFIETLMPNEAAPPSDPTPVPEQAPVPQTNTQEFPEPDLSNIPPSSYLSGISGSPQLYTLDCEMQAAVDFARFFGIEIDELEFISRLPLSDDPEVGFVGDFNGTMGELPPGDYGVHAKPIAKLLREYGLKAKAVRGWSLDQIRAEIAAGRPVIVWIVNLPFDIETQEYTASNGNTAQVARFEHTWIVTGYNMNTFTVIDSTWTYNVKISTLKERWTALGNQAIVYRGE